MIPAKLLPDFQRGGVLFRLIALSDSSATYQSIGQGCTAAELRVTVTVKKGGR